MDGMRRYAETDHQALRVSHSGGGFKCPCCNRFGMSTKRRHNAKKSDSRFIRRKLNQNLRNNKEEA
jgi:hypothetical protein